MKLVLSRKGFDGQSGGVASPILPDGRVISLPIPSMTDNFTFADLNVPDVDLGGMIPDLSRRQHAAGDPIHLDPDLDRPAGDRLPGWRPALGQTGAAQTHLQNNAVGPGDVFLFFGWFRRVELHHGRWRYVPRAPDLHVMFGWIEVEAVISVVGMRRNAALAEFPWVADHPHVATPAAYGEANNTLYVAREHSMINPDTPYGGGRFARYSEALRLTASGRSRSKWCLPGWFFPNDRPALTYHDKLSRWRANDEQTFLHTVGRGQEFVIDGDHYPELEGWVYAIVRDHS